MLVVLLALMALGAPSAFARDGTVTSFDGAKIVYSFFPAPGLQAGGRAPTVMVGPGYSSGRASASDSTVAALLKAGYNVLTWDPRGFGDSSGNVEIDSPDFEARDASALIDYLAQQPEAQLDGPGDPHLGMAGGSYGGGIQWITAATDKRVDVITPSISWHSLVSSLDKNDTAKGGWGSLLFGLGIEGSTVPGITGGLSGQPNGFQLGRSQDPHSTEAFADGLLRGQFSQSDTAFFAARGPDYLLSRIHIPTLMTQGTSDTLFTLHEAIENYHAVAANGVPLKMLWFCGSLTSKSITHGVCQTPEGQDPSIVLHESVRWLDRYLKGDTRVNTGSRFEWISDTGALHRADSYPPPAGTPLVGTGSGALPLVPGDTSGVLIAASPATNAVSVPLPKVTAATAIVGEPALTLDYSGTAPLPDARVYAQIVDDRRGQVVGPVVTPIQLSLDGAAHSLEIPIEGVALDATPDSSYTLQITDGSNVYFAQRQAGLVNFSRIKVSLPTVGAAAAGGTTAGGGGGAGTRPRLRLAAHPARVRVGCHRIRFRATSRSSGGTRAVQGATVTFGSHRARTNSRGYVRVRRCLGAARRYRATARKSGYRGAGASVRAVRRSLGARFAG